MVYCYCTESVCHVRIGEEAMNVGWTPILTSLRAKYLYFRKETRICDRRIVASFKAVADVIGPYHSCHTQLQCGVMSRTMTYVLRV